MKTSKQQFLKKLKEAPYSNKLILKWVETFKDDQICNQYLQAIEINNKQWNEYKVDGVNIDTYVDLIYNEYNNIQNLPHSLVAPILIGSCDEISNAFIAKEAMKNISVFFK
jgi:hypothetical protein